MSTPRIDIRPDHWKIVRDILQKHVPQYEVWAFGSRAKWTAKDYSDLDLCVVSDKPLSLSVSAALADDFSESDLPWKVDVVDWATTAESFRKIIERDKVVVQKKRGGEWKQTEVGRAFNVNPPRAIPRGKVTPFIPMDAMPEHSRSVARIDEREFTGSGTKFRNGDTLVARITPCLENGKTAFINCLPDGVVAHGSTEYIVLAGKPNESDNLFAYYLARSPVFRQYAIGHMEGTSGRQRVPSIAVENFSILLPSLQEQRAIAHILGTLDDKIELNRRMNETLEAMARAMFKSWFVDFDPVRAKLSGEPPESICQRLGLTPDLLALFPDRLVDSELGEIPEGWEVHGLDRMASLTTKSVSPSAKPDEIFEHYSISAFDTGAMPAYELGVTIKSNKYVVSPNAVLVSKLNPETPRVWLPAVKTARAVCSTEFMQFEPQFDCVRSYLYLLMKSEKMQEEILKRVTGSTGSRQRAQPSQIATLTIIVPAEKVVRAFDLLVKPMLRHTLSSLDQAQTIATLRDALLPKLLSGELRVPDVIEEAAA